MRTQFNARNILLNVILVS